jgi:hypothetical protein
MARSQPSDVASSVAAEHVCVEHLADRERQLQQQIRGQVHAEGADALPIGEHRGDPRPERLQTARQRAAMATEISSPCRGYRRVEEEPLPPLRAHHATSANTNTLKIPCSSERIGPAHRPLWAREMGEAVRDLTLVLE